VKWMLAPLGQLAGIAPNYGCASQESVFMLFCKIEAVVQVLLKGKVSAGDAIPLRRIRMVVTSTS
jgi:hypothetical protein